jgi:hypothetical protein
MRACARDPEDLALAIGLVPRRDFEVLDDSFVSGLRNTGSNSIVIKDAYIPRHRVVRIGDRDLDLISCAAKRLRREQHGPVSEAASHKRAQSAGANPASLTINRASARLQAVR